MKKYPSIFEKDFGDGVSVVYTGNPEKPEAFFNAANIEEMLGTKNPFSSASNRVNTLVGRIRRYLEKNPDSPHLEEGTKVELIGSVKPAYMLGDDGVYKVLGVKSSHNVTARTSYYYNTATVFYVLNTAMTDVANDIQHWINGEVLPAILKHGEYIGVRKDGIGMRCMLTESIKRRIDAGELTDKAYADVTDAVYYIRYGMHTNELRRYMCLAPEANIREALSQDELRVLGEIENKISGCIDVAMPIEEIGQNKKLIKLYRKSLV